MKIRFGTSGWRGIIAEDFTVDNLKRLSQAIANYLKDVSDNPKIVIGYDTRFMTEYFAQIVRKVMNGNEIEVLMCENPTPTPVISFYIISKGLDGGINLTASHNPPQYLGLKFNPGNGAPAPIEVTKKIEEIVKDIELSDVKEADGLMSELFEVVNPSKEYFEYLSNRVNFEIIRSKRLKVVADMMYGTAIGYLNNLLLENTENPVILHDYRDPYFGGYRPEPNERRMGEIREIIKSKDLHCGLAVDGDADRFGVVDDRGDFIPPDEFIGLVAYHLYKNKNLKGPSARSIATSHLLDEITNSFGYETLETPVGFKYLGELLLEKNIVVGGEESGGLTIQSHVPEKDGILACMLALEMLAYSDKLLSELREEIKEKYGRFLDRRLDVKLESTEEKNKYMLEFEKLPEKVKSKKMKERKDIDGIQYIFEGKHNWVLARPSGTEPVVRIYIEATDDEFFNEVVQEVKNLI